MSTNYPNSLDSLANPAGTNTQDNPSHSAQHANANDAIEAIESTVGTTLGTNVLSNFAAGEFPVRATGGGATGTLQQTIVGGTHANTLVGTSQITGGTLTGVTGAGALYKIGAIDIGTVVGTVTITGVGFQPKMVTFALRYAGVGTDTTFNTFAYGVTTGVGTQWSFAAASNTGTNVTAAIANASNYSLLSVASDGAGRVNGSILSLDADGFKIVLGTPAPTENYRNWTYIAQG